MKTTQLKFSSFIYLAAFRKYSKATHWEVNLTELTVICNCSPKEALNACKEFNAQIITSDEDSPVSQDNWKVDEVPFSRRMVS
jgi:hypothetical protein